MINPENENGLIRLNPSNETKDLLFECTMIETSYAEITAMIDNNMSFNHEQLNRLRSALLKVITLLDSATNAEIALQSMITTIINILNGILNKPISNLKTNKYESNFIKAGNNSSRTNTAIIYCNLYNL